MARRFGLAPSISTTTRYEFHRLYDITTLGSSLYVCSSGREFGDGSASCRCEREQREAGGKPSVTRSDYNASIFCRLQWLPETNPPSSVSQDETHLASAFVVHLSTMASNSADQIALIQDATIAIEDLLNNSLQSAQERLRAHAGDSPGHGVGLGISCFLQAALGQEDNELAQALDVLVKAEAIATAQSAKKGEKGVFPAGLEYKVSWASLIPPIHSTQLEQLLVASTTVP